jgi:hypothetical protein
MSDASDEVSGGGRASLGGTGQRRAVGLARLAIGLVQGVLLYWLLQAGEGETARWPATQPTLYAPLVLVVLYLPVVLLAGVGRLRLVSLAIWSLMAAAGLALIAWHSAASRAVGSDDGLGEAAIFPFAAAAVALFIGHHLVVPADRERRLIAAYPTYFDVAWMAGVQLALSLGFAGAFWLLLFLGAALFNVIGLSFLGDLIEKGWFSFPLTGLAFATAVQLTDVRDGLIRGVRTVALMLLSWLLLVLTVLVGGFLAALPFTGLEGLWATRSATALVLAAAGGLIILINAAYQDGRADNLPPAALRIAARVASVLLTPLIAIAAWGLMLRIGQHGLTPERIIAVACALVGAAYAGGYGYAALRTFWSKGDWMRPLEGTNVAAAVLEVIVILALFSPLADPARLSVADQTARLARGAVTPAQFDYAFLAFENGRTGQAALTRLAASTDPEVARRAREAQDADDRYDLEQAAAIPTFTPVVAAWPEGTALPDGFVVPVAEGDPRANCRSGADCLATVMDLNGDGAAEVLLARRWDITLYVRTPEGWIKEGAWRTERCGGEEAVDPRDAIRDGLVRAVPSPWPDLDAGGRVPGRFQPEGDDCTRGPGPVALFDR